MTPLPDKILVTRTYEIPTAELFKLAEEMGVHFANQQWGLWVSRRENPFPWGRVPAFTAVPRPGNQNACAKAGCSVEILDVAISYIERNGGLPKLDRDLYEVDGRRGAHYVVAGYFYRGFQGEWDRLRAADRAAVIERGLRRLDSCWAL